MFIDPLYILISIPALFISSVSFILVRYYYSKYIKIPTSKNINGIDVVEKVARNYSLNISLNVSQSELDDNYNPFTKVITLSRNVARLPTIGSIAIASHELGHVLQYKYGFFFISLRKILYPIVGFVSTIGYIIFFLGLIFQVFNLMVVGFFSFVLSTIFTILLLPIEFDASRRALELIRKFDLLDYSEISGAKKVLVSASLTYVASAVQSLITLLYYAFRVFWTRRD